MPWVTLTLNDLYPDSTTWAQVYKGMPSPAATGRVVSGTTLEINSAVPQNRSIELSDFLFNFDSDGIWTMEVLTKTPFGTDRITSLSFAVQGTATLREYWRWDYFGSTSNTGDGADLNDFDHDGLPNLVEYAFGLNPTADSSGQMPVPQTVGNNWVISFTQPNDAGGVAYAAEWSPNMSSASWQPVPNTGTFPQHTFSLPIGTNQAVFMRLKVTGQ